MTAPLDRIALDELRAQVARMRDERDEARAALQYARNLANEWEEAIAEGGLSKDWIACLRANLPALRDALDGGKP